MAWDITDVESLAKIDSTVSNEGFSPAEYEIIRQVIYRTADFDYSSLLNFSESALNEGTAALSAHTSIVVDISAIQTAIAPLLYETFCNPVYACNNVTVASQSGRTKYSLGLEVLAKNHPEGIYIIGQEQTALATLIKLTQNKIVRPSLVILTAPTFIAQNSNEWLENSSIPYICLKQQKGGSNVAISIITSLINLAWSDSNNLIR